MTFDEEYPRLAKVLRLAAKRLEEREKRLIKILVKEQRLHLIKVQGKKLKQTKAYRCLAKRH